LKNFPGFGGSSDEGMTDAELETIAFVRESSLEGFPDFTIEEVLLTKVEDGTLEWGCITEEGGAHSVFYVYATGIAIGDFVTVYAGFDVYDDGRIVLYNLDDGSRDEYYKDALEMFGEWYEVMLSRINDATA